MSTLPPKADIRQRIEHVCYVPIADVLIGWLCQWAQDGLEQGVAIRGNSKKTYVPQRRTELSLRNA